MSRFSVLVEPPAWAAALANVAWWAGVQIGTGYLAHRTPAARLARDGPVLRLRRWECDGRVYERLAIRRWKDRVPEAGGLFAHGTDKRRLPGPGRAGVDRFVTETRRAERAHWMAMAGGPVAALWNPPLGVALMVAYGVAVNLPFIAIQRYNRARCLRVLARSHRDAHPVDRW
jgi:glycosyl-4,4'-diaponeurosporenoate acyltransferase